MGFHIPDSPRSRASTVTSNPASNIVETRSVSVSIGTSMAGEDTDALAPPSAPIAVARQVRRQQQRRNAMIPILAAEAMAALSPEGVVPTDATQALLQFQDQLRSRGLLPPSDQTPKQPHATTDTTSTADADPLPPARRTKRAKADPSASPPPPSLRPVLLHLLLPLDMDHAVEKLLVRHEVAQAATIVKRSAAALLAPMALTMRRAHAIPQLGRYMTDRRSVFQPAMPSANQPTHGSQSSGDAHSVGNRKRKRKATIKPLAEFKTPSRLSPSPDALCPIRIDVDADGVRFQDTLLISSSSVWSPEDIAARIARDERLSDVVKDAISECIKRQLITFASFVDPSAESLHPIHLDLVIGNMALRDQFEWDIYSDLNSAEAFAATLCADLALPAQFEPAIAFSIREQVYAYRRILFSKRWIGNDPLAQKAAGQVMVQPRPLGISTLEPVDETVVREPLDTVLWQPVVSELGQDELQYLTTKISAQRRSMVPKKSVAPPPPSNGRVTKRTTPKFRKDTKAPRPINPFIMYCQVQRDLFTGPKHRRSAAESRKILGDMWRKMTDEDKEYYAQLTEVENEKRRRDHVFEMRDRAIGEWEDEEARRIGLLGSSVLDASSEHVRGLLLANYMDERHEVDSNRPSAEDEDEEEEDDDDGSGNESS